MSTQVESRAFLKPQNFKSQTIKNNNKFNIFNTIPDVNLSQIGEFLNFPDIIKTYQLQKKFRSKILSKYMTYAKIAKNHRYISWNQYQIYKHDVCTLLNNLIKLIPNLIYLEVKLNLCDLINLINGGKIILEIIQLLNIFKRFKKLKALNVDFNVYLEDEHLEIYKLLGSLNLEFLSTDLKFHGFANLIYFTTNLKYLQLKEVNGDEYYNFIPDFKIAIETLDLSQTTVQEFDFNLTPFFNLRRLILNVIDYVFLEDLMKTPNLEVLEYEYINTEITCLEQWIHKDGVPKNLKYLRCGNLLNPLQKEIFSYLSSIEYLIQENFFPDPGFNYDTQIYSEIEFSDLFYYIISKVKYLHIKTLFFLNLENRFEVLKVLYLKNKIQISFDKLFIENEQIPALQKYADLFRWNLKLIELENTFYYKLDDFYTPKDWLQDHNIILEPYC